MHYHNSISLIRSIIGKLISLFPILFWLFLIYGFCTPGIATMTLLCAIIHELGHLLVAVSLKSDAAFGSKLSGPRLYFDSCTSYKQTLLIALGGPAVNLIAALLCLPFISLFKGYVLLFFIVNLLTAFSNLLPIINNDGYNILSSILNLRVSMRLAYGIMTVISFLICTVMCFFSLYLMSRSDAGYWCYFISLALLVKSANALTSPK